MAKRPVKACSASGGFFFLGVLFPSTEGYFILQPVFIGLAVVTFLDLLGSLLY
jgi:hypothetical protein